MNNKLDNILLQIKALNDEEKRKMFLTLFNEMSFNTKSIVMADILEELKPQSASREMGNQEVSLWRQHFKNIVSLVFLDNKLSC